MKDYTKNSFIKQAFILAIASLLVRLLGFLYRLPLTEMLGDEGNGIYSAGFYLYNFFLVMSSAGLPAAISKIVSEKYSLGEFKNVKKVFNIALISASFFGGLFSILMFVTAEPFSILIGSPKSYYTILTLSPTVFIVSVMSVFRGFFQGLGTTVQTAISQIIEQIFNAIFSVLLAYFLVGYGVEYGAAGGTFGTGVGALAGFIYIYIYYLIKRKDIKAFLNNYKDNHRTEKSYKIFNLILKTAVPIITGTAIFSITNLIDMQMVNSRLAYSGAFTESEINALYGQLTGKYVTITTLPVSISTAIATAVLPSIAKSIVKKENDEVNKKITTTLKLTMIVSIPAAVGLGVLGEQILKLLFPTYYEGGNLLRWGSVSIIFLAFYQILTGLLQGASKVQTPAKNALIGAIIKIPINYFLIAIPSINVIGAIISTTVCYIVASLLNLKVLKKITNIKIQYNAIFIKPLISSFVMGVFCYLSYKLFMILSFGNNFSTILSILIGMFLYLIILLLIKGLERQDLKLLPFGAKITIFLEKLKLLK